MTTKSDIASDSALSTATGKPLSVALAIDYRNRSEPRMVTLPAIVGRGREADVRLDDVWISRIHCSLDEIDGTVIVRDLGAKNGIFVNGLRVKEFRLQPGDRFTLGLTEITVEYQPRAMANEVVVEAATTALADATQDP